MIESSNANEEKMKGLEFHRKDTSVVLLTIVETLQMRLKSLKKKKIFVQQKEEMS